MEREESVVTVPVIWRGKKFTVEINSGVYLKDFGDDLMKLTDVKADTMRLIVPQVSSDGPKLLMPFSDEHSCLRLRDTSIIGAKSIRMMGVSEDEIDQVMKGAKVDLRIAGFEEEERRMRQRITNRPTAPKLPQGPYVFCDFWTLELPGVQLNPPASEALKRMHMLAADPGIVAIMNKHRWRVGIMTEMAPVGYVGISPKCLLGFNKNQGEEISLRLRTDDLKGFRKYEVIKKTLLHELAHMIHTEHDENFYALDRQLNQEASTLDWTRSAGRSLTGVRPSENDDMDVDFKSEIVSSHRLGGQATNLLLNARAASIAAAYHRLTDASTSPVLSKRNKESSPIEWPGCGLHSEAQAMDAMRGEGADFQNQNGDMNEPDPVNNSGKQVKQEPDPDDSKPAAEIDHGPCFASEPDPDDMETTQSQPILAANIRMDSTNVRGEPDPDDLEVAGAAVESSLESVSVHSDSSKSTMRPANEPDPHDMEEKSNHQDNIAVCDLSGCLDSDFITDQRLHSSILIESDLDDSVRSKQFEPHLLVNKVCVEPDPDDSKTRKAVALEPDVDDNLKHLPVGLDEPDPDDEELQRIQDPVTKFCSQLTRAIKLLCNEVHPTQAECVLQTLVKIIRNVIENPNEIKYKRLRNSNPVFRRNIANYKAAVDILVLVGYQENVLLDESGKADTYLVLKRNDPGLLWLAKSFLETSMTHIMK